MRIVGQGLGEPLQQALALVAAGLHQVVVAQPGQDGPAHGRPHRGVGVGEPVDEPGRRDRVEDLGHEIRTPSMIGVRPRRERRRTVSDDLFKKLVDDRESFWTTVYPLYMNREITRSNVRDLVHKGLEEARGNYKIVLRLFNMESRDYKRFLNFLRKHDCQLPFKEYR